LAIKLKHDPPFVDATGRFFPNIENRVLHQGCVAKARNMLDIPALSRLGRQAPNT
jgi:hypothetical protein